MNLSNQFLALCEKLHRQGIRQKLRPGSLATRGFADFGSEPFFVLPGNKCLSLLSGDTSSLPEGGEEFFAAVPDCDEAVSLLGQNGYQIDSLQYVDQREWSLTVSNPDEEQSEVSVSAPSLQVVFLEALLFISKESS